MRNRRLSVRKGFDGRKNPFQQFEVGTCQRSPVNLRSSEFFRRTVGVGIAGELGYVRREERRQYGVCGYTVLVLDDP